MDNTMLMSILMLALLFIVMYFLIIRPQKKKDKEMAQMRSSLQVGDEVITVGGIVGRVVIMREDHLVIETGNDRSKLRIKRWAIQESHPMEEKQES